MSTSDDTQQPTGPRALYGDLAPGLVDYTTDLLFGEVWKRADLAARDRSLVTVTALITTGSTDQLVFHLGLARDNGLTEAELVETITHLAFYAGWPRAMAAIAVAKDVFSNAA